ncbi:MAG: DUF4919 domain-containing protein, partial [Bacteroidota bacterium]
MRLALVYLILASSMGVRAASAQADQLLDSLDASTYAELTERVRTGETEIDYRLWRLSFAASPGYNPYDVDAKQRTARMFDALFQQETPSAALLIADSSLAANYVHIDAHYGAGVAHDMLGNAEASTFHFDVFEGLMDSILRTAEGTSADPFIVINVDEEYTLTGLLGLQRRGQSLVDCDSGARCDRLELYDPNDGADLTFYFDVSIPFGAMRR